MDRTAILSSFHIAKGVLQDMAGQEEDCAKELDAICKDAGDWNRGVAAGLRIAVHLLADILKKLREEGQDAQINLSLHRHEKGAQGAAGPADR